MEKAFAKKAWSAVKYIAHKVALFVLWWVIILALSFAEDIVKLF